MSDERLKRAESILGVTFADSSLLRAALTHPSFAAENTGETSYERLEFLGDAVLSLLVAEWLFATYPHSPEGELTKRKIALVAGATLTAIADELGIADLVVVGRGASRSGVRHLPSVGENAFEALVGAVYVDRGIDAARDVFCRLFEPRISDMPERVTEDEKSALQERAQAVGSTVEYTITAQTGPAHDRRFAAEVRIDGNSRGSGEGRTKKEAEKAAARVALDAFGEGIPAGE